MAQDLLNSKTAIGFCFILLCLVIFASGQTRIENPKHPLAKNAGDSYSSYKIYPVEEQ